MLYNRSLKRGKIIMILAFCNGLLLLLWAIAIIIAGMRISNILLIIGGSIFIIIIAICILISFFDLFLLNYRIYDKGIYNPVPGINVYKRNAFYHFEDIIDIYADQKYLIIETEKGKHPITLKLLGKDWEKVLQSAVNARKVYYEKKEKNESIKNTSSL